MSSFFRGSPALLTVGFAAALASGVARPSLAASAPDTKPTAACTPDKNGYPPESCTTPVTVTLVYSVPAGRAAAILHAMSGPPPKLVQDGPGPGALGVKPPNYTIRFTDPIGLPQLDSSQGGQLMAFNNAVTRWIDNVALASAIKSLWEGRFNHQVYCREQPRPKPSNCK